MGYDISGLLIPFRTVTHTDLLLQTTKTLMSDMVLWQTTMSSLKESMIET